VPLLRGILCRCVVCLRRIPPRSWAPERFRVGQVLPSLQRIQCVLTDAGVPVMDWETALSDARRLLAAGDAAGALGKAEEALKAGGPRGDALKLKAAALVQLGRQDAAERALGELCEIRPDDAWAYVQLAALHFGAGRSAKARALLDRALALEPDNADARSLVAHLEAAGVPPTSAEAQKAAERRKHFVVPLLAGGVTALVLLGAFGAWWLLAHARPGPGVEQAQPAPVATPELPKPIEQPPAQPPVAEVERPPMPQPELTQPTPAPPPQPEVAAAQPAPAPQPPPPPKKPGDLKVLWYQAKLIDQQTYGDQVQQKYQIWGEVINDGDETISGVVVGWVSIRGEAVAWGVQALYNVPPHATTQFNMLAPSHGLALGSPPADTCQVVAGPMTKNVEALLDAGNFAAILQQFGVAGGGLGP